MENIVSHTKGLPRALLYQEAEPVRNSNFEKELARTQSDIAECEEKLNDPDLKIDEKYNLEASLESYRSRLKNIMSREYTLSPEQLRDYQTFADTLYFPAPGIFFGATDEGWNMKQLEERFAAGNLSAEEFVKQLSRIAQMVELENGQ